MSRAAARAPGRGLEKVLRASAFDATPPAHTGLRYRRPPRNWAPASQNQPEQNIPIERPSEPPADWPSLPRQPLKLVPVYPPPGAAQPAVVPPLAHGLDVVLRNGGVHPIAPQNLRQHLKQQGGSGGKGPGRGHLQQQQKRPEPNPEWDVLRNIAQPHEVDWTSIPPYIRASQDKTLRRIAKSTLGVRYSGSTSSMTMAMSAMYHAVSNFKTTLLNGGLTRPMADLPNSFTKMHSKPTAVAITPYPGTPNRFSIDAHQGIDSSPAILRDLGHSMERMLTMTGPEFREKLLRKDSPTASDADRNSFTGAMDSIDPSTIKAHPPQFYHYSQADSFLLRAQIDCIDPKTGNVFDLKTRAVAPIRYDISNYIDNTHRTLPRLTGLTDSFEREFYDMVRSVFLKYSLQLRIGRMSGAFVTYHNTSSVLGFEYLSLSEMEAYAFGSKQWTEHAFSSIVRLLGIVFDSVTAALPVSHPDYIKLVIVTHSSQKQVSLFAHRVHTADGDSLSPEKFAPIRKKRKRRGLYRKKEPKSVETTPVAYGEGSADFDKNERDEWFEMQPLPTLDETPAGTGIATTISGTSLNFDMANAYALTAPRGDANLTARLKLAQDAELNPEDLRCWNLSFATIVNGSVTRQPIELRPNDSFELRYKLSETNHDHKRVLRDYVNALYECYS
jgi:hypothetical protein